MFENYVLTKENKGKKNNGEDRYLYKDADNTDFPICFLDQTVVDTIEKSDRSDIQIATIIINASEANPKSATVINPDMLRKILLDKTKQRLSASKSMIEALQEDCAAFTSKINNLTSHKLANEAKISGLNSTILENEKKINDLTQSIETLKDNIRHQADMLQHQEGVIRNLQQSINTECEIRETECEIREQEIKCLNRNIKAITDKNKRYGEANKALLQNLQVEKQTIRTLLSEKNELSAQIKPSQPPLPLTPQPLKPPPPPLPPKESYCYPPQLAFQPAALKTENSNGGGKIPIDREAPRTSFPYNLPKSVKLQPNT